MLGFGHEFSGSQNPAEACSGRPVRRWNAAERTGHSHPAQRVDLHESADEAAGPEPEAGAVGAGPVRTGPLRRGAAAGRVRTADSQRHRRE